MCNAFSVTSEMCSLYSLVHKPVLDARPVVVHVSSLCPASWCSGSSTHPRREPARGPRRVRGPCSALRSRHACSEQGCSSHSHVQLQLHFKTPIFKKRLKNFHNASVNQFFMYYLKGHYAKSCLGAPLKGQ